jgi:hypothetical protein
MTEGTLVEEGNILNMAFPTSNIPNPPADWGAICEAYIIGSLNGGCYRYRELTESEACPRGYITTFDFILSDHELGTTTPGTRGTTARCWRIFIQNEGSHLRFIFTIGEDAEGTNVMWPFSPVNDAGVTGIQIGQRYRLRVNYNLSDQAVQGFVDVVIAGQVSGAEYRIRTGRDLPILPAYQIMGGSGSSDGRNTIFLLDNVRWDEIPHKTTWRRFIS